MDDSNSSNKYSTRLYIKTRVQQLIVESFKVVLRGEISVVHAKEITGWVPEFGQEDEKQSKEQSEADKLSLQEEDEDEEVVPGAFQHDASIHVVKPSYHTAKSYGDPFGLEHLILESAKKGNKDPPEKYSTEPQFPPGFTPVNSNHQDEKETKMVSFDIFVVKSIWGNMLFDFATCSARGRSGDLSAKRSLWSYILGLINQWHGEVVIMGDFNEVRFASERYGTIFHASHADIFNLFITDSHLIDVPLGGYSFTWSNKHASKMSKLDRFLISEGLFDLFLNLSGLILHRHLSDHKPIFLRESYMDYGPTPFRLFHSWFLENDFVSVVEDAWNNAMVHDLNAMVFLKNKLKVLKHKLKAWSCQKRCKRELDRKELYDKLIDIDTHLDKGEGLHDDVYNRADVFPKIGEIDLKNSIDMPQKAKIKWAIEGGE
ncbi:RNA-directed DNA polymerase, eukaryota, partial [Tanacetum coccineum]